MVKKSNEQTLKEVIEELLNSYRLSEGIKGAKIIHSWEKIAGKYIADHTEKIYIKNNMFYIKITSPALKNEMLFAKTKLLESLNNFDPDVGLKEIVFL